MPSATGCCAPCWSCPSRGPGEGAPAGSVAVGVDLSPLDPFLLKRAGVVGLATDHGGRTSHTAILAQAFDLPFVVGLKQPVGAGQGRGHPAHRRGTRGGHPRSRSRHPADLRASGRGRARATGRTCGPCVLSRRDGRRRRDPPGRQRRVPARDRRRRRRRGGVDRPVPDRVPLPRADRPSGRGGAVSGRGGGHSRAGRSPGHLSHAGSGRRQARSRDRAAPRGPTPPSASAPFAFRWPGGTSFAPSLRALFRAAAVGPVRITFPLISGVTELAEAQALCDEVCADLAREGNSPRSQTPPWASSSRPPAPP